MNELKESKQAYFDKLKENDPDKELDDTMFCNEKLPCFSYKNELAVHHRLIKIVKGYMEGFERVEEDKALLKQDPPITVCD